jgi:hypothetical protein
MEIKQSDINEGLGLHSTKFCKKGDIIFTLTGSINNYPTRESIYIGNGEHIYDEFGIYMNHSFTPTTRIGGVDVYALMEISPGTELSFNYNENEITMADPFSVNGEQVCGLSKA